MATKIKVGMRVEAPALSYRGTVVGRHKRLVVIELDRALMPGMPVVSVPASEVVEER